MLYTQNNRGEKKIEGLLSLEVENSKSLLCS